MAGSASALLRIAAVNSLRSRSHLGEDRLGGTTHSLGVQLDLLERETELAGVAGLIDALPDGGRLLAIEGPPGNGKTALLAQAKALGQESGLQVLGARGSELEHSLSYGVVRQLFEPFLASLGEEERAELLSGAAALAAPLFDPAQVAVGEAAPADSSLATLHGLYWLTANLAARRPLLLALDDLHWCDLPSLRWLAYLLPRMEGLGLLLVVGLRPREPGADPALVGEIVSDPLATIVRPAPLSPEATARLLRQSLSPAADDPFCAACEEATGGNPLLLRELVHAIAEEGLVPIEPNVPRLRELAARAGSRAVSLRLSRLPPEATTLAQAVAILGDDADPRQAAALADLDERAAAAAAGALARVDVLRAQPPLGFVHPLIRAAVYGALTGGASPRRHRRRVGAGRRAPAPHSRSRQRRGRRDAARRRPPRGLPRRRRERRRLPPPRARRAAGRGGARRSAARARRRRDARGRRCRRRASPGGARADRRPDPESRDREPARPPALPPPRQGGRRGLHPGAGRARRRRCRTRAPARGGAQHQHHLRAVAPPRGARTAGARPQPAGGRDLRRKAAACAGCLSRCAVGHAGRGGRPARAPGACRGNAGQGGRRQRGLRSRCHRARDGRSRRSSGGLRGRARRCRGHIGPRRYRRVPPG